MTNTVQPNTSGLMKHLGSCHCGNVRFEVELDIAQGAMRCNCSVCAKIAATTVIVKPAAFKLLSSEAALGTYEWGARVSKRYFCPQCGVHCFGRGHLEEVGGDYVSVNLNCLDHVDVATLKILHWDGRHNNWAGGLRPEPWPVFEASAS